MSSGCCFQNSASLVIICCQFEWASRYSIIYNKVYFEVSIALYSERIARSISFSVSIPELYSNVGSGWLHLSQIMKFQLFRFKTLDDNADTMAAQIDKNDICYFYSLNQTSWRSRENYEPLDQGPILSEDFEFIWFFWTL